MILSDLKQYNMEKLPKIIEKVLHHLANTNFMEKEAGKYQLDGDNVFVMVQDLRTKAKSEMRLEAHDAYLDIQYIVKGEELFGFCRRNSSEVVEEDLLVERDIIFFKNSFNEMDIIVREGQFIIFYPNDLHRPCCYVNEPKDIRKVVVKVKVDLLKELINK